MVDTSYIRSAMCSHGSMAAPFLPLSSGDSTIHIPPVLLGALGMLLTCPVRGTVHETLMADNTSFK